MRKKYKLIKEYPGSREAGTIVEKCYFTGSGVIGNNKLYTNKKGFGVESPENYPEYWEEIIEKDYEILSFVNKQDPRPIIYDICENGLYSACNKRIGSFTADECLNRYKNAIYSVKRLSDGEVFTIGDKITPTHQDVDFEYINSFQIENNICNFNSYRKSIKDLIKIKQPLFATEDGVDIFEGGIFCEVTNNFSLGINVKIKVYESSKTFSTKEKAEEYILMNKPCLSINDILSIYKTVKNIIKEDLRESSYEFKLLQLLKSRVQ
jgi:hypothetical protein